MMKSADFVDLDDPSFAHDLTLDRTLFTKGQMHARSVVVAKVRSQDSLQVTSAQNNEVIHAIPSDRSDQTLRIGVLPRTLRCREDLFNLKRLQSIPNLVSVTRYRHLESSSGMASGLQTPR